MIQTITFLVYSQSIFMKLHTFQGIFLHFRAKAFTCSILYGKILYVLQINENDEEFNLWCKYNTLIEKMEKEPENVLVVKELGRFMV